MKRKFLFVLTSAFFLTVTPLISASEINTPAMAVEQELGFTEVEVSEVPSAVIEAAKKEFPGTEVKEALVAEVSGEKIYKIVVEDADGNKNSGLYNKNGESFSPEVE